MCEARLHFRSLYRLTRPRTGRLRTPEVAIQIRGIGGRWKAPGYDILDRRICVAFECIVTPADLKIYQRPLEVHEMVELTITAKSRKLSHQPTNGYLIPVCRPDRVLEVLLSLRKLRLLLSVSRFVAIAPPNSTHNISRNRLIVETISNVDQERIYSH